MIEEEKSKLAETHKRRILTSLYHCLIPLLRDIGWYGSKEQLNQILPMENFSINIDDVRNSLTALRIITKTKFIRLNKIKGSNLPCIFTTKEGNSITIFEINEYGFSVFDGYTQKRQVLSPTGKKVPC